MAWGAVALECRPESLEKLSQQVWEGICLGLGKPARDGHRAGGQPCEAPGGPRAPDCG